MPSGDRLLHVLVGGGDHPHVHPHGLGAADPLELALLQHAQQLHLRAQVDVADLVEEQRAAFGQLEAALLARVRAGERALLVAEELRFDQRVGQRRAAHLHERLLGAQRVVVDGVRDQLLAGARLAADEHRRVRLRDLRDLLVHQPRRTAGADDVGEVVALAQLLPQVGVLVEQPPPLLLDQPLDVERLRDHRADDAEELHAAVEIALGLEAQVDAQRPDGGALQHDRHAHEAQFLAKAVAALGGAVEEGRFAADARHDDRLAALGHLAGNAFSELVAHRPGAILEPFNRFDVQLALAEQGDHPADDAVVAHEDGQDARHARLEIQRSRQGLARLEQGRHATRITRVVARFGEFRDRHFGVSRGGMLGRRFYSFL